MLLRRFQACICRSIVAPAVSRLASAGALLLRHFLSCIESEAQSMYFLSLCTISPFMNPRIVAISGPLKGSVFPLGEDDLRIGRDPRGDVYLDDLVVSRRHCTISYGEGGYTVLDLRSVIGTFVNGFCFPVKDLAHGDRIRVG